MANTKTTEAHVIENHASAYAVDITVSGFTLKGDEPVDGAGGGGGLGPAPYDMLLAALGECTAMTVRWYALQQKWPLDKVEVQLAHHKEGRTDIFKKKVTLHGDLLTDAQRAKLLEISAKCPIQRTLEGTAVIQTDIG